jgi:hypothetical protein
MHGHHQGGGDQIPIVLMHPSWESLPKRRSGAMSVRWEPMPYCNGVTKRLKSSCPVLRCQKLFRLFAAFSARFAFHDPSRNCRAAHADKEACILFVFVGAAPSPRRSSPAISSSILMRGIRGEGATPTGKRFAARAQLQRGSVSRRGRSSNGEAFRGEGAAPTGKRFAARAPL